MINPWAQLQLYRAEWRRSESREWQERLFEDLNHSEPETVVCHSSGCRLFLNTISSCGIPSSVRTIVFVQADLDRNTDLPDFSGKWFNFYCWWDQALLCSMLLNWYMPMGLFGCCDTNGRNIFYTLTKGFNLHQSVWRDNNFKIKLVSVL